MSAGISIIASAAYVNQELAVEFGHLPPAFLPVGNKRLFEYQIECLGLDRPLYITVPERYDMLPYDRYRLESLGVNVLPIPENLSLGQSIVYALNMIGGADQPVHLLHGDTLVKVEIPLALDTVAITTDAQGYSWAEVLLEDDNVVDLSTIEAGIPSERLAPILCGFFAFAHSTSLVRGITRAGGDFIQGLLFYRAEHILRASEIANWFDFGHVQTYFRSRRIVTSARSFNKLSIDGQVARKSSRDTAKMYAEINWFESIPPQIRLYSARLIDSGKIGDEVFYETEYEYLPTLAELYVFGTLDRPSWIKILRSCQEFLEICSGSTTESDADKALYELTVAKTASRLEDFAQTTNFPIDETLSYEGRPVASLIEISELLRTEINFTSGRRENVMHGDFCFSNILYDSRVQRIHVIDPRGYVYSDKHSVFGDSRYDFAKFAHSVIGRYDQIIAGRYVISNEDERDFFIEFEPSPHQNWLTNALGDAVINGVPALSKEILAININLFLSMLPLHADRPDRQRAFIANALRLFVLNEGMFK